MQVNTGKSVCSCPSAVIRLTGRRGVYSTPLSGRDLDAVRSQRMRRTLRSRAGCGVDHRSRTPRYQTAKRSTMLPEATVQLRPERQ